MTSSAQKKNSPDVMKAMVLKGHGGLEQLVWHDDWPVPTPKAGEVLTGLRLGLNNTDINTRTGWYSKEVQSGIAEGGKKADNANDDSGSWSSNAMVFPRFKVLMSPAYRRR